jgi:hypothetical protein
MWTILPFVVLLTLSLVSCSSSANSVTGPLEEDTKPTMDPGRNHPSQPCAPPANYQGLAGRSSTLSVALRACAASPEG